jgi:hypothetical protein
MTISWMKSIVSGEKKAEKVTDVKFLYAPMYETISLEEMLGYSSSDARLTKCLPDERDIHLLPRQVIRISLKANSCPRLAPLILI